MPIVRSLQTSLTHAFLPSPHEWQLFCLGPLKGLFRSSRDHQRLSGLAKLNLVGQRRCPEITEAARFPCMTPTQLDCWERVLVSLQVALESDLRFPTLTGLQSCERKLNRCRIDISRDRERAPHSAFPAILASVWGQLPSC